MKIAKRATLEDLQPKDIQRLTDDTGLTAPYIRRRIQHLGQAIINEAPSIHESFEITETQRDFMAGYASLVSERAEILMEIASRI